MSTDIASLPRAVRRMASPTPGRTRSPSGLSGLRDARRPRAGDPGRPRPGSWRFGSSWHALRAPGLLPRLPDGPGPDARRGPGAGGVHPCLQRDRLVQDELQVQQLDPEDREQPHDRLPAQAEAGHGVDRWLPPRPDAGGGGIGAASSSSRATRTPEEFVEHRELGSVRSRQAIGELREEYRTVIVLRHVEGYAYDEIAEVMDLPLGTVKTYLHRARGRAPKIARPPGLVREGACDVRPASARGYRVSDSGGVPGWSFFLKLDGIGNA